MRFVTFITVFLASSLSLATEKLNHITCEYERIDQAWEFYAVNYNSFGFSLQAGESRMVTGAWTNDRSTNVGYCITMVGTSDDSVVENVLYVYQARQFAEFDMQNCAAVGKEVVLIKQQSQMAHRGEAVTMTVENWYGDAPQTLLLKQYVPLAEEFDQIVDLAAPKCRELAPKN